MNYEPLRLPRLRSLHKSLVQRCSVSSVFVGAQARSPTPKPHTVSEMRGLRLTSTSCGISLEKTIRRSARGATSTSLPLTTKRSSPPAPGAHAGSNRGPLGY